MASVESIQFTATAISQTSDETHGNGLHVSITGTWTGTIELQHFIGGAFRAWKSYTTNTSEVIFDVRPYRWRFVTTAAMTGSAAVVAEAGGGVSG